MLSKQDNELLTRVGPGTPMGDMLRQYWMPFLFPYEVEVDGPPLRVRLLGEDLIAFRDSHGRIGLLGNNCAHRGASLFFGRNEESGLRCVYHGWKYDVDGHCVDMPNEPPESNFKTKIHHAAYPCVDRGGMVWTYMGPEVPPPPLPDLEITFVPDEHRFLSKRVQYNNWVQAMEGDIDQSHNSFLHTLVHPEDDKTARANVTLIRAQDKHPHFEVLDTDYGVLIGAGRDAGDSMRYWRISQFLMPFFSMTGPYGEDPSRTWRCWVPIDDENVLVMGGIFHPLRPLTDAERNRVGLPRLGTRGSVFLLLPDDRAPATSQPYGAWRPKATLENDFFVDRDVQRNLTFSGIPEFWAQDAGMQMSMGAIYDRSKEHLGTTDLAIISARRRLIDAAKALRERGATPPGVAHPEWYKVRGAAVLIPAEQSWVEATAEHRQYHPDVNHAGV
ncbi:MAG: Rieske (2Fe-2S) iron-sulfur domain protein [Chloroflexi bacterium]|nr:Rieske (2Fe-2S) iron-sulfur domain protein [Chloroflexota bacterium]